MMDAQPPLSRACADDERLTTDPVTGLRNQYVFGLDLPEEFAHARESGTNGALLAVKLDNIVSINAQHGRDGGDEALRAVAYILDNYRAAAERSTHSVYKLNGPVFAYFIPACSVQKARTAAENLLGIVSASKSYLDRLTVSIGVVNLREFFREEGAPHRLAFRVEQTALYRMGIAERQGTNTICDTSDTAERLVAARPAILVVEPEPPSIELLLHALETAGFLVETCTDGESAIARVQEAPPSLIICEAMTPRLSGFAIRQRLRSSALWNAIPFILVSHKKNEELIKKAVECDIRHFFLKPLSITEVVGLAGNIVKSGRQ